MVVCLPGESDTAVANTNLVVEALREYITKEEIKGVDLYYSKFKGYGGEYPTIKIYNKEDQEIVFGNKNQEEALEILKRYSNLKIN